jgi:hypothetical protein
MLTMSLYSYSQAVDVGSLKGVSAPTIRILVCFSVLTSGFYLHILGVGFKLSVVWLRNRRI